MNISKKSINRLSEKSLEIKKLILTISHNAQVGHIGSALSIADIITVLYFKIINIKSKNPTWTERDRFILSKGHAATALYSALFLKGFISKRYLNSYCKNGGYLGVHPEHTIPGVELTTGSLGHGLSVGLGIALSARLDNKKFHTYALISDAECDEGEIWQAAIFANHHSLNNLTVIVDYNKVQALGTIKEVLDLEPLIDKWQAFGWNVLNINGHDLKDLINAFECKFTNKKPKVIIANTIRGKGVSFMEHHLKWHYITTTKKQHIQAVKELTQYKL